MNPPGRPVPAHGWPAAALASEPRAPRGCGLGLLSDGRGQGRLIRPERTHAPTAASSFGSPGWLVSSVLHGGQRNPLARLQTPPGGTLPPQDHPLKPPKTPGSPGLQLRVPGCCGGIRYRPHRDRPDSGTWPRSRKTLPTLVFPHALLPPGGVGGGAGRCVGRYRPPTTRVQLPPRGRSSVAGKSRQALLCGDV